jgi:hypothetical protein
VAEVAAGKSSNTAVSSKSGKGGMSVELRGVCHVHAVDGVQAMRVADGLQWVATLSCWRNLTTGFQKLSGLDFQGSTKESRCSRVDGGVVK